MSVEVLDLLDDRSSLIFQYVLENVALHLMRQDMDFSKNLGEARQVLADLQEAGSVFSAGGEICPGGQWTSGRSSSLLRRRRGVGIKTQ